MAPAWPGRFPVRPCVRLPRSGAFAAGWKAPSGEREATARKRGRPGGKVHLTGRGHRGAPCRPANRPRRAPQGQRDPCSPWESQTARGRDGGGRPVCFRRGPPPGACMLTLLPPSRGSAGGSACSGVGLCTSARMPPSLPQRSRAHLTPLSGCSERSLGFSCRGGWGDGGGGGCVRTSPCSCR